MIVVLTDRLGPRPRGVDAQTVRPFGGIDGRYLNDLAERYRHLGARAVVFADAAARKAGNAGKTSGGWRSSSPEILLRGGRMGVEMVLLADIRLWPDAAIRSALERHRFSLSGLTAFVQRINAGDYAEVVEPSKKGYNVKRFYLSTSPHNDGYFPVALIARPRLLGVAWHDLLDAVASGDAKGIGAFASTAQSQVVVVSPWLETPDQCSRWLSNQEAAVPEPACADAAVAPAAEGGGYWGCAGGEPGEFASVVVPSRRHIRRLGTYHVAKRLMDICGALIGLALTVPLYPLIALAIKVNSRGPVFFVHRRQTLGGREFGCLKFRTMVQHAERLQAEIRNEVDGPQFHVKHDPRVTTVGRTLRRTNLDEIPQFWNVLLGHMSLVGPRPSPDSENQLCPAWREMRLSVRPGLTGMWQVHRSHERAMCDFDEWIQYDLHYVRTCSLRTDLKLLWQTVGMMTRQVLHALKRCCGSSRPDSGRVESAGDGQDRKAA